MNASRPESSRDVKPPLRATVSSRVTRVEVETDRGVFMISVAAELADMHPQTLRMYESRGLVEPKRSPKGTRLYSQQDVEKLRRIHEMTADLGLNLAGVQRVLDLESEVRDMHSRIEDLELKALHARVQLAQELEQVRRSYRAELVPFRGGGRAGTGTQLVRAADARSPFRVPGRQGNRSGTSDR
jgi:MerR family transcriptional regulator, heat shock protein HspR